MAFGDSGYNGYSNLGNNRLTHAKRMSIDRRSELDDRREVYTIDYFSKNNIERRKGVNDRRQKLTERRAGWVRVSRWSSVYVG